MGFPNRTNRPTLYEMDRWRSGLREEEMYGPQDPEERLRMQGRLASPQTPRTPFTEPGSTGLFNLSDHAPFIPAQQMPQFLPDADLHQRLSDFNQKYGFDADPSKYLAPESVDLLQRLEAYQRQRAADESDDSLADQLLSTPESRQRREQRWF